MRKRILSFLLCLVLTVGLATPAVQAFGADDVYASDNIMDQILIDGASDVNIVIDGNSVSTSENVRLPSPADLLTQKTEVPYTFGSPVVEELLVEPKSCQCVDLASAVDHTGLCLVKAPYVELCELTAEKLFAQWGNYTAEEQTFVLGYLQEAFPLKSAELQKLLSAPTGSASEILTDGTTVSVEGIPHNGSLSVSDADDEIKDIVDNYVAKKEEPASQLFSYDVSVQDGDGADWQPETAVKMELELPGEKLHKYSKVYVVHVDDYGEATTIEAEVTEDGKIVFETPGFSTFAGFTVDFDYEGVQFSIPGQTSIKLSELFENMKMPLNAEDVVNVDYTDDSQLKIEQLDGDWLLTSLKAFTTEEKLSLTMNDGSVYAVKVTDAVSVMADVYAAYYEGGRYWSLEGPYASGADGVLVLQLDSDGYPQSDYDAGIDDCGYFDTQPIVIDGRGVGGCVEIVLQKEEGAGNNLVWDIVQIQIINGAKVVIRLGDTFTGEETITFNSVKPYSYAARSLFDVLNGSLFFNLDTEDASLCTGTGMTVTSESSVKEIIFDANNLGAAWNYPPIYIGAGDKTADVFAMKGVTFRDSKHRGILCRADELSMFLMRDCKFESTIKSEQYGGGAIYIDQCVSGSTGNQVTIEKFELYNVDFDSNTGGTVKNTDTADGGAICIYGNLEYSKFVDCDFTSTSARNRGGAICIGNGSSGYGQGNISFDTCTFTTCESVNNYGGAIAFRDKCHKVEFTNCTFDTNESNTNGGAISFADDKDVSVQLKTLSFTGCTFTDNDCNFTGNSGRGGSVRMVVEDYTDEEGNIHQTQVTIDSTSFSGSNCGSNGGAFSIVGKLDDISIINGSSFSNNRAEGYRGGAISIACIEVGDITISDSSFTGNWAGGIGGAVHIGKDGATAPITVGAVSVSGCTFKDNMAHGVGGGLCLTDGEYQSISVQNTTFDNCDTTGFGGGIGMKVATEGSKNAPFSVVGDVSVIGCTFTNCHSGNLAPNGYTDATNKVPKTWDHDGDSKTPEIDNLNGAAGGGAIVIGGSIGGKIEIKGKSSARADYSLFQNCTTWNNGAAIFFNGDLNVKGVTDPVTGKFTAVDLQYLDIDKCFSRDAGSAIYLAKVVIPRLDMHNSIIQNCGFFDLNDPNFPSANVPITTEWFNVPTIYKVTGTDTDGNPIREKDEAETARLKPIFLERWSAYTAEDLFKTYDTNGTFRSIGNASCVANISDCKFLNNRSSYNGGGIYWNANEIVKEGDEVVLAPQLTVTNTVFDGNEAMRDGGAIYCEASIIVQSCEFMNNKAANRGGAIAQQIYNNKDRKLGQSGETESNNLQLTYAPVAEGEERVPTTIHNNTATHGGGVSITVAKTESVDNGTNLIYPIEFYLGGSHVYENKATGNGGGIYYSTETYTNPLEQREVDNFKKKIVIDEGLIWGNIAGYGATETTGGGSGGGIYMNSNQVNTESSIPENEETGYSQVSITGGSIYKNRAYVGNGGGVYLTGQNALCTISGDTTTIGGEYLGKTEDGKVSLSADGGNIAGNRYNGVHQYTGGCGGGIAIFGGARIEMSGGYVINNRAYTAGGGVAVHGGSTMYLTDGYIDGNESSNGGGISLNDAQGNPSATDEKLKYGMFFDGGVVQNNIASTNQDNVSYGGGICLAASSTMKLAGGSVSNNKAIIDGHTHYSEGQEGGGIAVCQGSEIVINGGVIENNQAYDGGGIVIRGGSVVTMTGTIGLDGNGDVSTYSGAIINNRAERVGGGVFMPHNANASMTMNGGYIFSNECKTSSGAVLNACDGGGVWLGNGCTFTLDGGRIEENKACEGGGICNSYGKLIVTGTKDNNALIRFNSGKGAGGGIYTEYGSLDIEFVTLSSNAGKYGGGVYLSYGSAEVYDGIFTANRSNQGAGFFIRSSGVTIHGGTFTDNVAGPALNDEYATDTNAGAQFGGGLSIDDYSSNDDHDSLVTINGGTFKDNSAPLGGGIYMKNRNAQKGNCVNLVMNGGTFEHNQADYGAAIYIDGNGYASESVATSLTMNGGELIRNIATQNGGGVYAAGKARVLIQTGVVDGKQTHGDIRENQANNGGGVFVTSGADLKVIDGFIIKNRAVKPNDADGLKTAKGNDDRLYGTGGGICVTAGASASARSTFTLEGDNMAIYGNIADFAADDVFASGTNTQLFVPKVAVMNLAGYGFNPEGWVEDYCTSDTAYTTGLNMINVYASAVEGSEAAAAIRRTPVLRYRNGSAAQCRYMLIKPEYVGNMDGTATVSGVYANQPDAYVCMTLGIPTAMDDTVIIDYGSEVVLNVWLNDLFLDADTSVGGDNDFKYENVSVDAGTYLGYGFTVGESHESDKVHKYEDTCFTPIKTGNAPLYLTYRTGLFGNYGVVYSGGDGTFSYTPTTMNVSGQDSFAYAVAHNDYWYYANITVIPATSIYFEDNSYYSQTPFIQYHEEADYEQLAKWTSVSDGIGAGKWQDEDRPGGAIIAGLDADNIYGYDSNYATSNKFSNGSAHKVTVSRAHTDDNGKQWPNANARATFTFTGTAFDIVSFCNASTGLVIVSVYQGVHDAEKNPIIFEDNPATDQWEATTPLTSFMVDTYYETGTGLYQVPVIKADMTNVKVYDSNGNWTGEYYGYGTYTVEIYVTPNYYPSDNGYYTADFYLDAIRIYDPAEYNGGANETINEAYKSDKEAWPVYAELRNMFINQGDLEDDTKMEGILFIDGQDNPTLDTYRAWGPNNEVYLKPGQSVAFNLDASNYAQNVAAVHLAMRGLTGIGNVLVQAKGEEDEESTVILESQLSTTDMYYDISGGEVDGELVIANKVVTITNSGSAPISITNVKVTHTDVPDYGYSLRKMFTSDLRTGQIALDILTAEQLADPVVKPKYPALSFNGMVCYNVFFTAEDLGELTAADLGLAVFDIYDVNGTVETAKDVIYGATETDGLYMVTTNGVHAKYLGDTQFFRVFAKKADGSYVYSKMVDYSALDYAENVLAKSDDVKLKQLVVAMLNYGAEAQKFFDYKTDDLVNKNLTADDQALLVGIDASSLNEVGKVDASKIGAFASTGGFTRRTPAISFKGAFEINYFFQPANVVDGDMTLYLWNEDTYDSVAELTVDNADKIVAMTLEDGNYTATSDEIAAKYLDKTVYVAAVYESGGVTYCSGVLPYSIASYCQKPPAGVQDLATAAAIYGCTAKQYFDV